MRFQPQASFEESSTLEQPQRAQPFNGYHYMIDIISKRTFFLLGNVLFGNGTRTLIGSSTMLGLSLSLSRI